MADLPITIIRKPIKNLYLRIDSDGKILVSAPKRMPMQTIQEFINSKQLWIEKKQLQQSQRKKLLHSDSGEHTSLKIFDKKYHIRYEHSRTNKIILSNDTAYVNLKEYTNIKLKNRIIDNFYRQQLLVTLQELVNKYQPIIGVNANEIRIKKMKTKWGTCNTKDKRLWLNLQLVHLPLKCCEYVVVHEMIHLIERYHNKHFYSLVERAMPDYKIWHNYLKEI